MRFRPPACDLEPELLWLLTRAFSTARHPAPEAIDARRALELAATFDLGARLATRSGFEELDRELGREAAEALVATQAAARAEALRRHRTVSLLLDVVAARSIPLALLKGQALEEDGIVPLGGRFACDVDLLVPEPRARELAEELTREGYALEDFPESEHQLTVMSHPRLAAVEIHLMIPGVRLAPGEAPVGFEGLERADHLVQASGRERLCMIPSRAVLMAHLLAHGVAQHGWSPASYPLSRMLADLSDLGVGSRDGDFELAAGMTSASVNRAEATAVRKLCDLLERGALEGIEETGDPPSGALVLLRHLVAGQLDRAYRESLRLRIHRPGLSGRSTIAVLTKRLWRMVFKTRAELEVIYGPTDSKLRIFLLRLVRPFDLVRRGVIYLSRRVAVSRRSGS